MADCVFCGIVSGGRPASIAYQDERCVAFLDIHPVRPGHLLVVPRAHAVRAAELGEGVAEWLFAVALRLGEAARAVVPCDDVHVLLNDGPGASQTVPHTHVHVVPRARGDAARFLFEVVTRPLAPLRAAAPRDELDERAAAIARYLARS